MLQQEFNGKIYRLYKGERYFSRGTKRLHRVVWEFHNGPIPKGYHIHHKDKDRLNNSIGNLEMHTSFDHLTNHMTPERREVQRQWVDKIRHLAAAWHRSPEGLAWHKKHGNGGSHLKRKKVIQ